MHYKEQPPDDFLKDLKALVASYPGIALSSVKCVKDSPPSTQPASSATAAPPPPKKTKKGCPAITKHNTMYNWKLGGNKFWQFGKLE